MSVFAVFLMVVRTQSWLNSSFPYSVDRPADDGAVMWISGTIFQLLSLRQVTALGWLLISHDKI